MKDEKTSVSSKDQVRAMDAQHLTARQIATALGLSTQRVYVLLKQVRAEREAEAS